MSEQGRNPIEEPFEAILWSSRFLVLIAVLASLIASLCMFAVATTDCMLLVRDVLAYVAAGSDPQVRASLHGSILAQVAEVVDGYLFATILIIFGLGLYELFISKINPAERSELAARVLLIRSLDDLKERLAKVIFLILIVRYFEYALQMSIANSLDLLYIAIGIVLIALALYLTNRHSSGSGKTASPARSEEDAAG